MVTQDHCLSGRESGQTPGVWRTAGRGVAKGLMGV